MDYKHDAQFPTMKLPLWVSYFWTNPNITGNRFPRFPVAHATVPCVLLRLLEAGVNFVFGTTGGDRDALMKVTQDSGVYAVIDP